MRGLELIVINLKKKTRVYMIALFSINFIHLSTSFFFQSQNSVYIFKTMETIASVSHRVSIVPYIVGAKEVFIFFNYEVPLRKFSKKYIFSL